MVAVVNGKGEVNTTTALTKFANENNARSATSSELQKTLGRRQRHQNHRRCGRGGNRRQKRESTQLDEIDTNVRQVEVVDGQLYMSADPTKTPDK